VVNDEVWIEVHVLVPSTQSVAEAHHAITGVENQIRESFPGEKVHITTHIEPAAHETDHPEGHPDVYDPLRVM
jgi:divalent metal cation (Fe/Co/Zn/Cd) transporter